jgi:ribosome maturation factor RimP
MDRESEDFELQVSSPGLGQPLKVIQQYFKAVGEKIEILLKNGDQLKGTLEAVEAIEGRNSHQILVKPVGTKKKPAPAEPVVIDLEEVKSVKVEFDFNKL